jgi:MFS family permease
VTGARRRAVWVLGACQCVFWGVLYYGFSVLLQPMELDFGVSRAAIAGAFTAALLITAFAAPLVGRWIDRDRAPTLFRCGAALAVAGMELGALARSLPLLYLAWLLLGAAMAALLYEPAFGLVLRAFERGDDRLRALAAVTVAGGLASTIFLPLLSLAVARFGWRHAWGAAALAIVLAALAMERYVLPELRPVATAPTTFHAAATERAGITPPPPALLAPPLPPRGALPALIALFGTSTFAGMAFSTLLIPLLLERGHSPTLAAGALGLLGAMQLPGRLWMLRGGGAARGLFVAPLALQAAGLAAVAAGSAFGIVVCGTALFGLGAGLHTVARPFLIGKIAGVEKSGAWNGEVARAQGLARAGGPLAVAMIAGVRGVPAAFALLALALALLLPVARNLARQRH